MENLFTTKLFLVLLTPIIVVVGLVFLGIIAIETWGINKTVGWAWDFTNFNLVQFPLYILFLLSYGTLSILRIRTQFTISIIHVLLIALSLLTFSYQNYSYLTLCFSILSSLFFITNISLSIKNRKSID